MSEHPRDWPIRLPAPAQAPVFIPPDPTALIRAGRRTRRMHALVAAATATALVAVGGTMVAHATGNRADRVRVVTPAIDRHPSPAPHHSSRPMLVGLPDQPAAGRVAGRTAVGTGARSNSSVNVSNGAASAPDASAAAMMPTATDFRRTTVTDPPTMSCAYQPETAPSGWCLDYIGPDSAPAGRPVNFAVDICRIKGLGSGALRFATAQEADVWVLSSGKRQWEWSHGRSFASTPHSLTVAAGTCLRWTTTWTTEDNSGRLFPPGTYSLEVAVESPDVDLPNSGTSTATTFTLT